MKYPVKYNLQYKQLYFTTTGNKCLYYITIYSMFLRFGVFYNINYLKEQGKKNKSGNLNS